MNKKVMAAVVTYKNPERLQTVLACLKTQMMGLEISVKDNTDDPVYYTVGINIAIKECLKKGAEYVLICADDIKIHDCNMLTKLLNYMETHPDCGMSVPIHLDKNGAVTFGGGAQAFPYGHHVVEPLGNPLYKEPFDAYWANTSCALIRREALEECGLLDENMRFVCSDADFSFTLRSRGWGVTVVPEAHIEHDLNRAFKVELDDLDEVKQLDFLYFITKWLSGGLYRELSLEGKGLTMQEITARIQEIQMTLQKHAERKAEDAVQKSGSESQIPRTSQSGKNEPKYLRRVGASDPDVLG